MRLRTMNRRQLFFGAGAAAIAAAIPKAASVAPVDCQGIFTSDMPAAATLRPYQVDMVSCIMQSERNVMFSLPTRGARTAALARLAAVPERDFTDVPSEITDIKPIDGPPWTLEGDKRYWISEEGIFEPVDRSQTQEDIERFYRGQLGKPYRG